MALEAVALKENPSFNPLSATIFREKMLKPKEMKAYKLTANNRVLANSLEGTVIDEEKQIVWSKQKLFGGTELNPRELYLRGLCEYSEPPFLYRVVNRFFIFLGTQKMKAYNLTHENRGLAKSIKGVKVDEERQILWSELDLYPIADEEKMSLADLETRLLYKRIPYELTPASRELVKILEGVTIDEEKEILWSVRDLGSLARELSWFEMREKGFSIVPEETPLTRLLLGAGRCFEPTLKAFVEHPLMSKVLEFSAPFVLKLMGINITSPHLYTPPQLTKE